MVVLGGEAVSYERGTPVVLLGGDNVELSTLALHVHAARVQGYFAHGKHPPP